MLAASRFTVGSVLEQQAEQQAERAGEQTAATMPLDHDEAFQSGLSLIIEGLALHRHGQHPRET